MYIRYFKLFEVCFFMINILVTGPRTDGISGGQATHIRNLAILAEQMKDFNISFYFTSKGLDGNDSVFNKFLFFFKSIIYFPFFCSRVNVVHVNTSFDIKALMRDTFFLVFALLFGSKIVVQYHGGNPSSLPSWLRKLATFQLNILKKDDVILCLTDSQKSFIQAATKNSVTKVKNFVELPVLKKKVASDCVVSFLYMGRMIREKGIFLILESAKLLLKMNIRNFNIRFCGSGKDLSLFQEKIQAADLGSFVYYVGTLYGSHKSNTLNASDVFLYPTSYPEGLPYSILEAMSFKLPVISTNVGSITSVVTHNSTGIIIPEGSVDRLAKSMKFMIENADFRVQLGSNARMLIETEYSFDAMQTMFTQVWGVK